MLPALAIASLTIGVNLLIDNLRRTTRDEEPLMGAPLNVQGLSISAGANTLVESVSFP